MSFKPEIEFAMQVDRLVELGYPTLAGVEEAAFRSLVDPLREQAAEFTGEYADGRAAFVLVVSCELVSPHDTVPLLRLTDGRRPGVVDRNHAEGDLATYQPLEELAVPRAPAYLLMDVERGEEFCNVRPEDALLTIRARGRTPLTIDEGIAVVTHVPQLLERNKCFMLSGSRRHDRRVPAMWISKNAPKLGWCWDGNPHTWLGVASARERRA